MGKFRESTSMGASTIAVYLNGKEATIKLEINANATSTVVMIDLPATQLYDVNNLIEAAIKASEEQDNGNL
jgi:hypothetical protein